jgi:hypothetical protein
MRCQINQISRLTRQIANNSGKIRNTAAIGLTGTLKRIRSRSARLSSPAGQGATSSEHCVMQSLELGYVGSEAYAERGAVLSNKSRKREQKAFPPS